MGLVADGTSGRCNKEQVQCWLNKETNMTNDEEPVYRCPHRCSVKDDSASFSNDEILDKQDHRLPHNADSFSNINERPVDDISIEFFYKPHTISLLVISIAAVIYFAFHRFVVNNYSNYLPL